MEIANQTKAECFNASVKALGLELKSKEIPDFASLFYTYGLNLIGELRAQENCTILGVENMIQRVTLYRQHELGVLIAGYLDLPYRNGDDIGQTLYELEEEVKTLFGIDSPAPTNTSIEDFMFEDFKPVGVTSLVDVVRTFGLSFYIDLINLGYNREDKFVRNRLVDGKEIGVFWAKERKSLDDPLSLMEYLRMEMKTDDEKRNQRLEKAFKKHFLFIVHKGIISDTPAISISNAFHYFGMEIVSRLRNAKTFTRLSPPLSDIVRGKEISLDWDIGEKIRLVIFGDDTEESLARQIDQIELIAKELLGIKEETNEVNQGTNTAAESLATHAESPTGRK